jgi:hypothetical protein
MIVFMDILGFATFIPNPGFYRTEVGKGGSILINCSLNF